MNDTTNTIDIEQIDAPRTPPSSLKAVYDMLKGDASCARMLHLTAADFEPLKDSEFSVEVGDKTLSLKLVDVTEQANLKAPGESRAPFSLQFTGPKEPLLPQGTYPFSNPKMDALDIFIVPVGQEGDTTSYEAVFN